MTVTNNARKPLRIFAYLKKNRQGHYHIAYFDGKFRFVHGVSRAIEKTPKRFKSAVSKAGKPFVEYVGDFVIARNGNIYL